MLSIPPSPTPHNSKAAPGEAPLTTGCFDPVGGILRLHWPNCDLPPPILIGRAADPASVVGADLMVTESGA